MSSVEELKANVIWLLEEAGFTPDLYFIKLYESSVCVHFDDAGAVKYFKEEIEMSQWAEEIIFESRKEGKRHVACLQLW